MRRGGAARDEVRSFGVVLAALFALAGCAFPVLPANDDPVALPDGVVTEQDLRGTYRATLCARPAMAGEPCTRTLYRFAGETPAPGAAAADAARYRILLVPGFLAACYPGIHSFADVVLAARNAGFAADVMEVGARDGIGENALRLAAQIDRLPPDGRRLVLVGHSKGVADALALLVARPDLAARVVGVVGVAGAFRGSPLADSLAFAYRGLYGVLPPAGCATGAGDPVGELTPARRADWWNEHGAAIRVPLYALVTVPRPERLSPVLVLPHALLAARSRYNDGMLLARDQVPPGGRLLGIVDADHLTAAIPYPTGLPWALWFIDAPFPRADVLLAAVDVVMANAHVSSGANGGANSGANAGANGGEPVRR